ncbi:MAG: hypothetical protein AAF846_26005 [Chloroflexota bacterium]
MINQRERQEKITRMKLQTAKVLWQEGRKDATFLLVESIDDPRGDALREQMGFSDEYKVGVSQESRGFSLVHMGSAIVISPVIFFFLGFLIHPKSNNTSVLETTMNDNQVISTLVAPTPALGETLSRPLIALTVTADSEQPTVNAVATQQSDIQANIALSSTASYRRRNTDVKRGTGTNRRCTHGSQYRSESLFMPHALSVVIRI